MALGERRGRPSEEKVQNFAQFEPGQKTREIAAKEAGFGNPETYRDAKQRNHRRTCATCRDQSGRATGVPWSVISICPISAVNYAKMLIKRYCKSSPV